MTSAPIRSASSIFSPFLVAAPTTFPQLRAILESRYGSLASPQFFFVQDALDAGKHEEEKRFFTDKFGAVDDTDPNNDVGLFLVFEKNGETFCVLLSFVGPYAAFLKGDAQNSFCLTDETENLTPDERAILLFLRDKGWHVLSEAQLKQPVEIQLDIDDPTVYNALFTCTPMPFERDNSP